MTTRPEEKTAVLHRVRGGLGEATAPRPIRHRCRGLANLTRWSTARFSSGLVVIQTRRAAMNGRFGSTAWIRPFAPNATRTTKVTGLKSSIACRSGGPLVKAGCFSSRQRTVRLQPARRRRRPGRTGSVRITASTPTCRAPFADRHGRPLPEGDDVRVARDVYAAAGDRRRAR